MVMPTLRAGDPGEVTSFLELIIWMLRRHVDEASVATLVETLIVAVQRVRPEEGSPSVGIGCVLTSHLCPGLSPPVTAGRAQHRWLLVFLLGRRGGSRSALGSGQRFPLLKRRRLIAV